MVKKIRVIVRLTEKIVSNNCHILVKLDFERYLGYLLTKLNIYYLSSIVYYYIDGYTSTIYNHGHHNMGGGSKEL